MEAVARALLYGQVRSSGVDALAGLIDACSSELRLSIARHAASRTMATAVHDQAWHRLLLAGAPLPVDGDPLPRLLELAHEELIDALDLELRRCQREQDVISYGIVGHARDRLRADETTAQVGTRVLSTLASGARRALTNRYAERLTLESLARMAGTSDTAVATALFRARATLAGLGPLADRVIAADPLFAPLVEDWLEGVLVGESRSVLASSIARHVDHHALLEGQLRSDLMLLARFAAHDGTACRRLATEMQALLAPTPPEAAERAHRHGLPFAHGRDGRISNRVHAIGHGSSGARAASNAVSTAAWTWFAIGALLITAAWMGTRPRAHQMSSLAIAVVGPIAERPASTPRDQSGPGRLAVFAAAPAGMTTTPVPVAASSLSPPTTSALENPPRVELSPARAHERQVAAGERFAASVPPEPSVPGRIVEPVPPPAADPPPLPPAAASGHTALLLTGKRQTGWEGINAALDAALQARLERLGLVVQVVDELAFTGADPAKVALVVVSNSTRDGDMNRKLKTMAVPAVVCDDGAMHESGLCSQTGFEKCNGRVTLGDGRVVVVSATDALIWGTPAPKATIVASLAGVTGKVAIFTYDRGAMTVGGPAPAKRVGFGVPGGKDAKLSDEGWALFDTAVGWAVRPGNDPVAAPGAPQARPGAPVSAPVPAAAPAKPAGPGIVASRVSAPHDIDLVADGTMDWVHWGASEAPWLNRKAIGGHLAVEVLASATPRRIANGACAFSWTDGAPNASGDAWTSGVTVSGSGRGFSLRAPAGPEALLLRVYLFRKAAGGRLEVSVDDPAVKPWTDTGLADADDWSGLILLRFAASKPDRTLTVRWVQTTPAGAIGIQGATLASAP